MIEKIVAVVTILSAFAGGWIYVDGKYAKAEEVYRVEQQTIETIQDLQVQMTADELNELQMKEQFAPTGLSKWDEVRQQQLEKKWELLTK